ncbi:MAG: hypothetical protein WHT08_16745 [Bryobacteraceae bacterium]|jgi:hypothetical protein
MKTPIPAFVLAAFLSVLSSPLRAQNLDFTLRGGGGIAWKSATTAFGTSLGGPYLSKNRLQFDYLFHNAYNKYEERRHILTLSYMRQASSGRVRGFFQVGAGLASLHSLNWSSGPQNSSIPTETSGTSVATLLGGGATIDLRRSLFLRPEFRLYSHDVEGIFLFTIGVGWRF